jgi:hypothetical protein
MSRSTRLWLWRDLTRVGAQASRYPLIPNLLEVPVQGIGMPMTDTYTKIILTVIAASLAVMALKQATPAASAQFGLGCDGSPQAPCYVRLIQ